MWRYCNDIAWSSSKAHKLCSEFIQLLLFDNKNNSIADELYYFRVCLDGFLLAVLIFPVDLPVIFSCDQAVLWMVSFVCLSIRLSICPSVIPFSLCSSYCIIMKFSEIVTIDKGDVHAKGQDQRSKVKVINVQNHTRLLNFLLDNSLPLHFVSFLWCHKQFFVFVACIISAKQWLVFLCINCI